MKLNDPAGFGTKILEQYLVEGWASLSKRDLELLMFILLEKDGALDRSASNYEVGRALRVTQAKVASLRRDAYARWRPLTQETSEMVIRRVLLAALRPAQLTKVAPYASERRMHEGFLPLLVEHPDDRAEIEQAIKAAQGIPVYERNREVVLMHYSVLLEIAEPLGLLEKDVKKIQSGLKHLLGAEASLEKFLKTPLKQLSWTDTRAALNEAGTITLKGGLQRSLPALLKLMIPALL